MGFILRILFIFRPYNKSCVSGNPILVNGGAANVFVFSVCPKRHIL